MARDNDNSSPEQGFWDARFDTDEYLFGTAPNAFLRRTVEELDLGGGRALAVADGEGRNGVWLAEKGFSVDSVDFSANAVAKADKLAAARGVRVNTAVSDLFAWAWPENTYDLVAMIFVQFASPEQRPILFGNAVAALKPGGWLLVEGYGPKQLEYGTGGPRIAENLYTAQLLAEAFEGFEDVNVSAYDAEIEEGARHRGMSALVDFVGRKPAISPAT